eukprot:827744-Rhodomonas_salina.1
MSGGDVNLDDDVQKMMKAMKEKTAEQKAAEIAAAAKKKGEAAAAAASDAEKGSGAGAGPAKPNQPPPPPPPGGGGVAKDPAESLRFLADGASAVRPATAAEEEIKKKEKYVRDRMQQEYGKMMKEQQRLEEVRRELAQLSEPTRRDVEIIRERLEKADRDLAWCRRDHDVKKKAYETALEVMEKKDKEKQALADHLRL